MSVIGGFGQKQSHWERRRVHRDGVDLSNIGMVSLLLYFLRSFYNSDSINKPLIHFHLTHCKTISSLWSPFRKFSENSCLRMESKKKSFKDVLVSLTKPGTSNPPIPKEVDEVIGALAILSSAEKVDLEFSEEEYEDDMEAEYENSLEETNPEFEEYVKKLSSVWKDINVLEKTCLIGNLWKGKAEVMKIKNKITTDWKFIKGETDMVDRANNWFEIHFTSEMDKNLVWDRHPFFMFGVLLVLMPWRSNFDPSRESIKYLDLWVRILFLPTEYMSA